MNRRIGWIHLFTLMAALVLPGRVLAQAATAPQPLVMTATNLMAGDQRHKDVAQNGGDQNALMAGDVVRYRLVFTNLNADSLRNVQFTNPIPGGLRYVAASAGADRSDVTIDFSIDGGKTWSAQPMIDVIVDGKPVRKPAPVSQYTTIRWTVGGWVQSKSQVTAEYKAELPAPSGAPAER
jgi:uncharacterized repeat protein (TIGR01451 family)